MSVVRLKGLVAHSVVSVGRFVAYNGATDRFCFQLFGLLRRIQVSIGWREYPARGCCPCHKSDKFTNLSYLLNGNSDTFTDKSLCCRLTCSLLYSRVLADSLLVFDFVSGSYSVSS